MTQPPPRPGQNPKPNRQRPRPRRHRSLRLHLNRDGPVTFRLLGGSHPSGAERLRTRHQQLAPTALDPDLDGATSAVLRRHDQGTPFESVVQSLCASSGEYQNNRANMGDRVAPRIVFWPHEHPKYFPPGIKQKWVARP